MGRYKRGSYTSSKTGMTHNYRSGWEHVYMQFLDDDVDTLFWDYECVSIPYISNVKTKKQRNYLPDFFVVSKIKGECIIEIKPLKRIHHKRVTKKTLAAGDWCRKHGYQFILLTEVELKAMSLL